MCEIFAAKADYFSIATDGRVIVISTILTEKTLHEPGLRKVRGNIENPVEKNLSNFPTFFRNRPRCVSPIDTNNRVLGMPLWRSRVDSGDVFQ